MSVIKDTLRGSRAVLAEKDWQEQYEKEFAKYAKTTEVNTVMQLTPQEVELVNAHRKSLKSKDDLAHYQLHVLDTVRGYLRWRKEAGIPFWVSEENHHSSYDEFIRATHSPSVASSQVLADEKLSTCFRDLVSGLCYNISQSRKWD